MLCDAAMEAIAATVGNGWALLSPSLHTRVGLGSGLRG